MVGCITEISCEMPYPTQGDDEATKHVKDRIKYKQVQVKGGRKLATGVRNRQRLLQKLESCFTAGD